MTTHTHALCTVSLASLILATACGHEPDLAPADACGTQCTDTVSTSTSSSGTTSSGSGIDTSGSSTSNGGSETSAPSTPCLNIDDCTELDAPYCDETFVCVPCDQALDSDAACAALDPAHPLCDASGNCVSCSAKNTALCDEQRLVCDEPTGACLPCDQHEDCASGACELTLGSCFPIDSVLHIDGDGPADYPSIGAALLATNEDEPAVLVVHELDGGTMYFGTVNIGGNRLVALIAAPDEHPIVQGSIGNPSLGIDGAGTVVYVDRLDLLANSNGLSLQVDASFVWVDRSRLGRSWGGGILAENGAHVTVRSSFVGGGAPDVNAITLDASTLDMLYTTVGGGVVILARSRALFCTNSSTANVRNSILMSVDTMLEVLCPGAVIENSATEADVGFDSTRFVGYAAGDFHLTPTGAKTFANLAQWQTGDPRTDIDGEPRPTVDLTPDYAGADIP